MTTVSVPEGTISTSAITNGGELVSIQEYEERFESLRHTALVTRNLGYQAVERGLHYKTEKALERAITTSMPGACRQYRSPAGVIDIKASKRLYEVKLFLDGAHFQSATRQILAYIYHFGQSTFTGHIVGQVRYSNLNYIRTQAKAIQNEYGIVVLAWWDVRQANNLLNGWGS